MNMPCLQAAALVDPILYVCTTYGKVAGTYDYNVGGVVKTVKVN